jgi:hypothetical protein
MFGSTVGVNQEGGEADFGQRQGTHQDAGTEEGTCKEPVTPAREPEVNLTVSQLVDHYLEHEIR